MNKQELITFIQSLPENLEVMPLELSEAMDDPREWDRVPNLTGEVYQTVYRRENRRQLNLRLQFTDTEQAEFQRDRLGNPQWANMLRVRP